MNDENKKFIVAIIFSMGFMISGYFAYLFISKPIEDKAKLSQEWPVVQGKIVASNMLSSMNQGNYMYSTDVHYDYTVDGTEYRNSGISVASRGSSTSSKKSIMKKLSKYPVNKEVEVHYNPDNPQESVLETKLGFGTSLLFKIPWIFVVAGAFIMLSTIRQRVSKGKK